MENHAERTTSAHTLRVAARFLVFVLVAALALPAAPALAQSSGTLSVPGNVLVAPGQSVVIPVTFNATAAGASGIDVTIAFDSARLDAVGAALGAATSGWLFESNLGQTGIVVVSMATSGGLPAGSSEVALITLHAKSGTTGTVALTFTKNRVDEKTTAIVNGSVRINTAPVAVADGPYSTVENALLTVAAPGVLGNDTDVPDNEVLTAEVNTSVSHGSLMLNANGSFTYTPAPSYFGPDSFTYRAVDPWGAKSPPATVSLSVGAVNDPPVANAGPDRSVGEGSSITLNGSATDVDNTQAQLAIVWDLNNDGTFETPGQTSTFDAAAIDGPDSRTVTLKVTDPSGLFSTDTAVVTINNVAPTANAGGPYFVDEGGSIALNGSASSDPAGLVRDPLTYAWDFADGGSTTDANVANPTFSAAAGSGPANRTVTLTVNDGDGGTDSATANITIRDVVALDLPEVDARWLALVAMPVSISGLNSTLTALDLTITYPPALLTFGSATGAGLTAGWTVAPSTPAAGQVRLLMTPGGQAAAAETSGQVALLNFTSTSAGGGTGPVTFSAATINGGAVSDTNAPGSIHLLQLYALGGAVTYWNGAKAVPGVAMELAGDDPHNTATSAAGAYNWPQVYEGSNYSVTPSKSDQVFGIASYDAALVLRHAAGTSLLNGLALLAGDVTGNGAIESADASLILKKSVGDPTITFPGVGAAWRFDSPVQMFATLDASHSDANFTAYVMGDVSGNWDPTDIFATSWPVSADTGQPLPVVVSVQQTSSTTVIVTIALVNAPAGILSLDMAIGLSVPATLKQAAAVQKVLVAAAVPSTRTLRVGIAATQPLTSGIVATIQLTVPAGASLNADVTSLMLNERMVRSQSNALYMPIVSK